MSGVCPRPPAYAGALRAAPAVLPIDTVLVRFHSPRFGALSFNPNVGPSGAPRDIDRPEDGARFSPFSVLELVNSQLRQFPVAGRAHSLLEAEIVHSDPQQYPMTRRWAQYFYNGIPTLQGLAWRPRLGGEGISYVLFGDRVARSRWSGIASEPSSGMRGHTFVSLVRFRRSDGCSSARSRADDSVIILAG